MPTPTETFDPRRFQTTVPFYSRYRLGYPALLIRRVIERVGLKPGDPVMDLGCGPGLLTIPFAQEGMKVTGVDPEPGMLDAAADAARKAGVTMTLKQGSSFDLPTGGPFKLVTMGRSFHWMDREPTLAALDKVVTPDGAVALLHDLRNHTIENRWREKLNDLADRYGRTESCHVRARQSADHRSHESVLMSSVFNRVERVSVFVRRELSADDVVGLAFSMSTSSPQKLGDKKDQFESELRAMLAEQSPDDRFVELAEMTAVIARRP